MIYLDSAATTLIKPAGVESAVVRAMRTMASPGRGGHAPSLKAAEEVYLCREAAARLFNVEDSSRVVFTFNATHALNIAIHSVVKSGDKVVISGFEHNSVTRPLAALGADVHVAGTKLFDTAHTLNDFETEIKGAKLVVCTHVSNVFGDVLPVYEIGRLCAARGIPFIVDASQSAGLLDVDFARLNAKFVAMPGHKALFGPQGTGTLLCAGNVKPLIHGGSGSDSIAQHMPEYLPDALEAGTHNVCGIAGLRAGIEYILDRGRDTILRHEQALMSEMITQLSDTQELELFVGDENTQCGVLSARCSYLNCEEFAARLSERGICVRAGLHCAPRAHKSAGTLQTGTVRFSFSPFLTRTQIQTAARIIKETVNDAKKNV